MIGVQHFPVWIPNSAGTFSKRLFPKELNYLSLKSEGETKINPPGWLKKVLKLILRKLQLWKAYKNNRTNNNFDKFKAAEKQAIKAVHSAKRSFEKKLSRYGSRKPFDSYVRNKTKARIGIGPLKKTCGTEVSDKEDMATLLNNTFCSVFTTENLNNYQTLIHSPPIV